MSHQRHHLRPERQTIPSALPLVAITGTRGKSTVAWLLYRMARAHRLAAGLWCTSGVYIDDQQLAGELKPWAAIVRALSVGDLDVAIQELEPPVVASVGLPEATYELAAITTLCGNDETCMIAPAVRSAPRAHEIVVRAVHPGGTLVLNADDPAVLQLATRRTGRVVLFGLHPENPAIRRCRATGAPAIWYSNGSIVTNRALLHYGSRSAPAATLQPTEAAATSRPGADEPSPRPGTNHRTTIPSEVPLLQVQEIPCTLEGALTFQIQNVMCATALALALGIPPSTIRAVTSRFVPSPAVLPGSCNLVPICGREVLIDGARYPWMLRPLIRGIRQRKPRKTFVLTHDFPWLSEDELREVGRILGRVRGMIVAYGLSSDDRLRTLSEGIAHNVLPPVVVTQPAVEQALRSVLNLARAGDVCLVLASNPEGVIRLLSRLGAEGR